MFTFILTAGPLQLLEVFAIKVFSSNAYITLAYSSIVHALYIEILSTWKIKRAIILSCNTIAYLRKFHRTAAQNLQVPARVCDVESGAVCSKNSTFGYLDGTAWTLRLRSLTSIMAPDNAPFVVQPRPQGLLAFQYGGGRREDPGTQRTKTIADWCIPLRVHTCALIGSFLPKQRWLPFEGFVEA